MTVPSNLEHASFLHQIFNFKLINPRLGHIKRTGILLLLFALLTSAVIGALSVNLAGAQTYATITILSDGSVEGTNKIQRDGDLYTFTGDIFGTIIVKKANITIDGAGYTLQGNDGGTWTSTGIRLYSLESDDVGFFNVCEGILVKNVRFYDVFEAIYTSSNNNSFINNSFDGARIHIIGGNSSVGNVVKHNIFTNHASIFVDYWSGTNEIITENNFIDSSHIFVSLAFSPTVDRNYWSNYTTAYPNAKEVGNSGVWDTPYVAAVSQNEVPYADYNPLVNPVADAGAPPAPQITANPEIPITLIAIIIVVVIIVSLSLLIYFKKRK